VISAAHINENGYAAIVSKDSTVNATVQFLKKLFPEGRILPGSRTIDYSPQGKFGLG
jgi:hypothetical protein